MMSTNGVKSSEIITLVNVEAMSVEDDTDRATELNLHLNAGELVLIQLGAADLSRLLADVCLGLAIVTRGKVSFDGHAWSDRSPRQAAAARERIGRVFRRELWINHLTIHQNVEFAQLHHTRNTIKQIRADTDQLGATVGWSCAGYELPTDLSEIELRRASMVRAFAGSPDLILLEEPIGEGMEELASALIDLVKQACGRGAAVIWFSQQGQRVLDYNDVQFTQCLTLRNGILQERSS
jgi:ABC-type ATPase involved in cell division